MNNSVYKKIKEICQDNVQVVIVSKMRSVPQIKEYYDVGARDFGENRVQDWMEKRELLPQDIRWHFIGRLQTNKVKEVVTHASLLHSLDRFELIRAVEKEAAKQNKQMACLLQFNLTQEETKAGFSISEIDKVCESVKNCEHIQIQGIMCIGPHVDTNETIRDVFHQAHHLFNQLKKEESPNFSMNILSMGMSQDYEIAIEEGSNMVRIGSILF